MARRDVVKLALRDMEPTALIDAPRVEFARHLMKEREVGLVRLNFVGRDDDIDQTVEALGMNPLETLVIDIRHDTENRALFQAAQSGHRIVESRPVRDTRRKGSGIIV